MKNKKKKQLPLLLLALLFITTAAYGTRAYFTDTAKQDAGIKLTLGNLKIKADSVTWKYTTSEEKKNTKINIGEVDGTTIKNPETIKNVQPGDQFTGTFTFQNSGSLDQVVTAETALEKLNNGIITFEVSDSLVVSDSNGDTVQTADSVTVSPNELITITVVANVGNTDKDNDYNEVELSDKYAVNAIKELITVNAVQTNK